MNQFKFSYLFEIQYLGFRFSGWMKQPNTKTIQMMVEKTIAFILEHDCFKTLGAGRTDAKVSAEKMAFQLFVNEELPDSFLKAFDANLPTDIKALSCVKVDPSFNIIKAAKIKEYIYLFSFGEKPHPFSAAFITNLTEILNLEQMKTAAKMFEGEHDFSNYCTKPSENTQFRRTVLSAEIVENTYYKASFFPENSYAFKIRSKGFLRYQIRLIMGQLFLIGKEEITLDDIEKSLTEKYEKPLSVIAPSSSLIVNDLIFED